MTRDQSPRPSVGDATERRHCAACSTVLAADNTARLCGRCLRDQRDQLRTPPLELGEEFWSTDDLRAAFESQHIGRVCKAYRHHPRFLKLFGKALNQDVLGRWLGLNQAQVSKLENGKPEQNLEILRNYAGTLGIPQAMLWFDLPGQTRIASRPNRDGEAHGLLSQALVSLSSPLVSTSHRPAMPEEDDPGLRLRRLTLARSHFEQMYRNSGGLVTGSRIDSFLARQALPMMVGLADTAATSPRLQRAMGGLIALAGVCAYDAEEWGIASSRFAQALAIAEKTRDHGFHAYVVALMVNQALALEDFKNAETLATIGLQSSAVVPMTPLAVDLRTMRAKALAAMGDGTAAMTVISEIETAASNLTVADELAEASYAQEGHLHAQLAEALFSLGELDAAREHAERSIVSEGHPRGRVNRLASMATLEVAKGEIERASSLACEMVEMARGMDSRRLGSRFVTLRSALANRPTSASREAIGRIDSAIALIP